MTGEKTRLYKAMKKRDIRQYTLANRVGISASVLSRYCSGQKEMPLYVAEKIADIIGCKLEEIIEVKKYSTKKPDAEPIAEEINILFKAKGSLSFLRLLFNCDGIKKLPSYRYITNDMKGVRYLFFLIIRQKCRPFFWTSFSLPCCFRQLLPFSSAFQLQQLL